MFLLFLFFSDIDECALPEVCHNGHCVNNEGSYSCTTCGTGYKITADGFSCEGNLFNPTNEPMQSQ